MQDFVSEYLANDDVRVDPFKKQAAAEAVAWTEKGSPRLSSAQNAEQPAEGRAEALVQEGKIEPPTFTPNA